MLNKAGDVLLDTGGHLNKYNNQVINLAKGERLVGIRSQQLDDRGCEAAHCNMVFVIARRK